MPRYEVENMLTDIWLGTYDAPTAREAIDAAYRERGWKDFADARAKGATAAREHEIAARRVDDTGKAFGPYLGYRDEEP
jgi:hypothetical protein